MLMLEAVRLVSFSKFRWARASHWLSPLRCHSRPFHRAASVPASVGHVPQQPLADLAAWPQEYAG